MNIVSLYGKSLSTSHILKRYLKEKIIIYIHYNVNEEIKDVPTLTSFTIFKESEEEKEIFAPMLYIPNTKKEKILGSVHQKNTASFI